MHLVPLLLGLALIAAPALAQEPASTPAAPAPSAPPPAVDPAGHDPVRRPGRLAVLLDLDAGQRERLRELLVGHAEATRAARAALADAQATLRDELRAQLSPEQRAKLDAWRARAQREMRRPPAGPDTRWRRPTSTPSRRFVRGGR